MNEPKFPEEIQCRITDGFLSTFKSELEKIFIKEKPDKPTYWNYYQWYDTTCGFYKALKNACELYDFMDLYNYLENSEWYDSDILDSSLTEMMYERGIIEEGSVGELYNEYNNPFTKLKYRIILLIYNIKQYIKKQ